MPINRTADEDGSAIVVVTLMGGKKARLFAEDFDRLMEEGYSPVWDVSSSRSAPYVFIRGISTKRVPMLRPAVADLIVHRKRRQNPATSRDGDPLNLRRDNLFIPPYAAS
ncbi:hypothetical protein C3941_09190 [Kaistia algarum]|nr:hypothetical protein C3941_09190 [Kaistia algarum]